MRIATWNINSVRLRLPIVLKFLAENGPDVLCLQETKSPNEFFPADALAEAGYAHQAINGMKGYNGVAILSRHELSDVDIHHWVKKDDSRHIAATLPNGVRLHNLYVPAGGDEPDPAKNEKFDHKLKFVDEMKTWFRKKAKNSDKLVLVGDLNIAPSEHDVWSHKQLLKIVSHTPVETDGLNAARDAFGWIDAVRHLNPDPEKIFSWWSYRSPKWEESNKGRRLDHIWVTPPLTGGLSNLQVLKHARGWEKPSDHVPVMVDI
ncbi:MAG: exodeoxyribonuclease III [Alphaproteobacteria bacterium]